MSRPGSRSGPCPPTGHEFSSLLLAVLNADGQGKNFPDRSVCDRVRALNGPIRLTTDVSLTCTNCPDVVQALNAMVTLNPGVEHETVDGAIHQAEVAALNVQGVPSVFADGELLHVGRGDFGELLAKLEARYGIDAAGIEAVERRFDVVVLGGGPAGVSAAIYSARKGLSVALVAERIGGQVNETVGIENLISVPETTGRELVGRLAEHLGRYPVEVFERPSGLEGRGSGRTQERGDCDRRAVRGSGADRRYGRPLATPERAGRAGVYGAWSRFLSALRRTVLQGPSGRGCRRRQLGRRGGHRSGRHLLACDRAGVHGFAEGRRRASGQVAEPAERRGVHFGADDIRRRRRLESDRRATQGPCERRGADDSARRRFRADRTVGQQRPVRRLAGAEPGRRDRYRRLLPDGHSRRLCGGRCLRRFPTNRSSWRWERERKPLCRLSTTGFAA